MAYPNFAMPLNHPFLSAGQGMPPPPGVAQPLAQPGQPTGQFPINPGTGRAPGVMPMLPPQQVGMVPGVPGSMGINPTGAPTMTPPHVIAGQPGAGFPGINPNLPPAGQNFLHNNPVSLTGGVAQNFDRNGWQQAIQAWRAQRPDRHDDHAAFNTWRSDRPSPLTY